MASIKPTEDDLRNPSNEKFFIKLFIYSRSAENLLLFLQFKTAETQNDTSVGEMYCSKVEKGEILNNVVARELDVLGNISEFKIFEISSDGDDQDRFGNKVYRYGVHIIVPNFETEGKRFNELSLQWVEFRKLLSLENSGLMFVLPPPLEHNSNLNKTTEVIDVQTVIVELEQLGYLKYVSADHLEMVRKNIAESYLDEHTLSSGFEDDSDSLASYNLREYLCDSENLAEGGVGACIEQMRPFLEQEGVVLDSVKDELDEESNYHVYINNTPYLILKSDDDVSWTTAYDRLIEIVNELLVNADSNEQLYAHQYAGNDTQVIFLTFELYKYMCGLKLDRLWEPIKL